MRWAFIILGVMILVSVVGRLHHYVPGQEENPALAKAAMCGVAESIHEAMIERVRETGLVVKSGARDASTYSFEVNEAMWQSEPIESKELIAIAGWCQVAGDDGRAVAVVIGNTGKNELASVIEGEFAERAPVN